MFVQQIKYSTDNLGYLIYSEKTAAAIDAGGVEETLAFAEQNGIQIKYITNTHSHYDHTPGNDAMLNATKAEFIDCRKIKTDQVIQLDGEQLKVMHTPGHTKDSVTFAGDDFLITGDTLFNGTIGNCFSGDLDSFFHSLKRLMDFPDHTKIYSGHDYVMEAIQMAREIEKENEYLDDYLEKYTPGLVVSILQDERNVNPFIRFNAPSIVRQIEQADMPAGSELDRFKSIMEIF